MDKVRAVLAPPVPHNDEIKTLNWEDSPSVQKLLDVISSILADEYIQIAKKNKDVIEIASSGPSAPPRNDDGQVLTRR